MLTAKKLIPILLMLQSISVFASNDFEYWKKGYINRASKRGISSSLLKRHLKNVVFNKEVILKEKEQITSNKIIDYNIWVKKWLREDKARISTAKEMLIKHKKILDQVERIYHVDKEIIISLWGVETLFGEITGDYDLSSSLASLAYKSRRKRFFEIQLSAAFRLIQKGHVKREDLKGSWAGATGQLQFMPSNFNAFARDFDGDKKKDIWNNHGDIFASIAYYLKKAGWKQDKKVGRLVKMSHKEMNKNKKRFAVIPFNN